MSVGQAAFLFAACVLAGAVNAIAGGGTLLSFPAAIAAGLPPIVANATNAVALVPGSLAAAWTYRRHLTGLQHLAALLFAPAIVGALIGARILRHTPQRLFDGVVPWLVLAATLVILLQGLLVRGASRAAPVAKVRTGASGGGGDSDDRSSQLQGGTDAVPGNEQAPHDQARSHKSLLVVLVLQFLVSIYGGYFGAAMGIVMLAFLGHISSARVSKAGSNGRLDLHQMNAIKNVMAVVINGAASVDFIAHGLVRPGPALLMSAGAITGGVVGARFGRRAQPHQIRRIVVAIGFAMAALLAWRRYGA